MSKIFDDIEKNTKLSLSSIDKEKIINKLSMINTNKLESYDKKDIYDVIIKILSDEITEKKTVDIDINSILEENFNIFNHKIRDKYAYIILDSKNRIVEDYGELIKQYKWKYVPSNLLGYGSFNSNVEFQNIKSIKLYKPYIPYIESKMNTPSKQITILIEEFAGQSFILGSSRRAHWILSYDEVIGSRLGLKILENKEGKIDFYKPIKEIDTLTITYGNPDSIIDFYPDRNKITFIPAILSRLITSTEHYYQLTDTPYILIEGFTTTNPIADKILIDAINTTIPYLGVVVSTTEITIPLNTTGLIGVPTGNIIIYYQDRRIISTFEVSYDDEI
jgi:hypothetical protein